MTPEERTKELLKRIYKNDGWPIARLQTEVILAIEEAVRDEREACAKVADQEVNQCTHEAQSVTPWDPKWLMCACTASLIAKMIRIRKKEDSYP